MELPVALQSLFTPGVTDVMFIGARHCFLDQAGRIRKVDSPFSSDAELSQLLIELALESGSRLDLAKPLSDFGFGNFRFSAQLKSAIADAPCVTIRRHPKTAITLEHLLAAKFLTQPQLEFIEGMLAQGKTFLISGPTSAGKTTLLGAMIRASGQRVVVVEQTPELVIDPPSLRLTERANNQQGVGLISQTELLSAALRMRPDRLAIGEVRGAEFLALLQAINNGHPALATIHARKLEDLPNRLLLLGQLAAVEGELVARLCQAIDYVIQIEIANGARQVSRIAKLVLAPEFGVSEVEI